MTQSDAIWRVSGAIWRVFIALVFALTLAAPVSAQSNPCTAPRAAFTVITSTTVSVVQTLVEYGGLFGGTPIFTDVEVAAYVKGIDPASPSAKPTVSTTTNKSAWSLVAGTADCYRATLSLAGVPANTEYELWARTLKGTTPGPWVMQGEQFPFGLSGPPRATTGLRIVPTP